MDDLSLQQLLVTNFGLSPSGYTGSIGAVGATGPAGGYTGSAGSVGYVGSVGGGVVMTVDTFTGDGTTTAFALTTTPESINRTTVNYNGVTVLRSAYTLSQANVTFSSAPAVGSQIEITTINSAAGSGSGGTALKITTIGYVGNNTATNTAGGETITLTGTGYVSGASVLINGIASGVVTVVNDTQLTFSAPALAAGTYILYVVNPDGATAISVPGISYSGVPSFYTGAGSVGTVYEASSFNSNVAAVGDATITYTIASGSLPAGATLNGNGVITGSSVLTASPTTYTFGVNASDGQNQDVTRAYTITVNPDLVTWSAPANAATVSLGQGSSSTTTLTAVSAAGSSVTYTANALPTGLSIVGSAVTGTPTVLGNTTALLTATATSTTRSATITVTWNIAVTNEPYFMYTSLLLSGNGSNNANNNIFVDSSTNNFAITRAGNTTQGTFSPYGPNWSNYFDGTGDYLSVPANSAFDITTTQFTVECWIYRTVGGAEQYLWSNRGTSSGWEWRINSTNLMQFFFTGGSSLTSTGTIPVNTWTHLAVSRDSSAVRFFINGALDNTTTFNNSTNATGIGLYLGYGTTGGGYFPGYMSNARLIKGNALYTSAFTPSTTPLTAITNTSLLTCQSNRFIDNSSNNLTITKNGDVLVQRFSPFSSTAAYSTSTIGGSGYFDGTGDYLSAPSNAAFNVSSNNVTAEAWIYITAFTSGSPNISTIWSLDSSGSQNTFAYVYSSGAIAVGINGVNEIASSAGVISLNTWYHTAVVRNGSTTTIYVNGVSVATNTTSVWANTGSRPFLVGSTSQSANYYLKGYISNVRFVNGTAVYTSAFTPPTAPLTAITNTSILLNYTNAGIIDNTMINNIETVGDAKISTVQSKFDGSSMVFDGSGDWLTIPSNPIIGWGTGAFTIECWLYWTGGSGENNLFCVDVTGGLNLFLNISSNWGIATRAVDINNSFGTPPTKNVWNHIAVSRSGSTIYAFINGTLVYSGANTTNYIPGPLAIAAIPTAAGNTVSGYIDDLRITRGYARYTANFTPPASAFSQK